MKTLVPLLALPLLGACVTTTTTSAALPSGSQWAFTTIDGAAPVSSKAKLTVDADRIGANVGCNGMGGTYTITTDRLVTGPVVSTMMYCDGLMAQERAVFLMLDADPTFTVSGTTLRLEGGGHRAELKRLP